MRGPQCPKRKPHLRGEDPAQGSTVNDLSKFWPGHLNASMGILVSPSLFIHLFVWGLIVYLSVTGSHTVCQTSLELSM